MGALFLIQIAVGSYFLALDANTNHQILGAFQALRQLGLGVLLAAACFVLMAWPRLDDIRQAWNTSAERHDWRVDIAINCALYAALLATAIVISDDNKAGGKMAAWAFWPFCILAVLTGLSLMRAMAPAQFWLQLGQRYWLEAGLSAFYATLITIGAWLMTQAWQPLSATTLWLTGAVLSQIDQSVDVVYDEHVIGLRDFYVHIAPSCSGYEGIALVSAFSILFLFTFRDTLRFPNAYLLIPAGVIAIALLNVLRIVVLMMIGGYVSADVAIDGFHSQGGWLAFLCVSIGLLYLAHGSAFFNRAHLPAVGHSAPRPELQLLDALLAPFMAFMVGRIIISASAPYSHTAYPAVVILIGPVLWYYRNIYAGFLQRISILSVVVGIAIGVAWIATAPPEARQGTAAAWLVTLPAWLAFLWIALRGIGTILLVPIAEELAFRGFLHRALIARDWHQVAYGRFGLVAFVVSSILFGVMHDRWLAGALAGAVFALLMYRTGRLSDPIAAHMSANTTIFAYACLTQQWGAI
jgi:exosortase E/protease (VPEID-CTERM system)